MRTRTLLATATAVLSLGGLAALGGGGTAGASTTIGLSIANASFTDKFTNNEITIAVNPRNTDNLVIGDNDYAANNGCGVNYSLDGGETWGTHSFIPHITRFDDNNQPTDGRYDFAGDPAVAFGPNGNAYFACYGYLVHGTFNEVVLYVSTSTDGGRTWGRPAKVTSCDCNGVGKGAGLGGTGQFPDHEAITVDNWAGSPHRGRIYVAQAQFHGNGGPSPITLFWSDDGTHWSKPVAVSHSPLNSNQDGIPAVGPDGAVYVTFDNSHSTNNGSSNSFGESVYIAKSTNGGASFGPDYLVTNWVNPVDRDLANSEYRASSYAVPGVDSRNRLTVVWNDRRAGASQAFAQRAWASDLAQGASGWTAPLRLHPSTHEQFFPWLSVAGNNRVDIVYYDRTADPNNFLNFVTYNALTPTGNNSLGVTNLTKAITPATSSDGFDGSLETGQVTTSCSPFIGDYIGVASTSSDVFLGWADNGGRNNSDPLGNALGCDVNEDDFSAHLTY
jgi:hypothetical protein